MHWYTSISFFYDLEKFIKKSGIQNIRDHIGERFNTTTPTDIRDGITFVPKDYEGLIKKLEAGTKYDKLKSRTYSEDDPRCFAGKMALKDTKGRGYRSVFRAPVRYPISAGIIDPIVRSSLPPSVHFKISKGRCNIHLDLHPFVQLDGTGQPVYNPDAAKHAMDELFLREGVGSYRLNMVMPYSGNGYDMSKWGLSVVPYERIGFDSRSKLEIGAYVSLKRKGIRPTYKGWGVFAKFRKDFY